jgi:hypothetical protein
MKVNYRNLTFLLIAIAFTITISAVLSVTKPIGMDCYYHLNVATFYAHGQFAEGWNYSLTTILFPYMPLFHLMLVPLVWSGQPYTVTLILQAVILPTVYTLIL